MTVPKKRIRVVVKRDGSVVFSPQGYTGGKCKDVTKNLEKAFGGAVKMKRTVEWTQKEVETESQNQKGE